MSSLLSNYLLLRYTLRSSNTSTQVKKPHWIFLGVTNYEMDFSWRDIYEQLRN